MADPKTDPKNAFQGAAMHVALQVAERGPNLAGPSREQLLVVAGIARELSHRNVVINQLAQELLQMTSLAHQAHRDHGQPTSPYDCATETCRAAVGYIRAAGDVATSQTAIVVGE